jgi:hypothetical protein
MTATARISAARAARTRRMNRPPMPMHGCIRRAMARSRRITGNAVYIDANPYRCYGFEAEIRRLQYSESPGMNQTTFLAGPRVSFRSHGVVPCAKLLVGVGIFNFPYHDGSGSYFVVAPGAGLDWNMGRRVRLRLIEVEYQDWSQFTFGPEHPYGASVGISYQIVSSGGWGHPRYRRD